MFKGEFAEIVLAPLLQAAFCDELDNTSNLIDEVVNKYCQSTGHDFEQIKLLAQIAISDFQNIRKIYPALIKIKK